MSQNNGAFSIINVRLPVSTLQKVDEFDQNQGYENRTKAINVLLLIATYCIENLDKVKDDGFVKEIKHQIDEGDIYKFVQSLNSTQLKVLMHVVEEATKRRFGKIMELK
jgi:metal-responsive CopG/Arc/MetJ family transcriptional regulator